MNVSSTQISQNLQNVRQRIHEAAKQYHRAPASIHLLAVSKKKSIELIRQAYHSGQRWFGENYLQEALNKIRALKDLKDVEFHFIGDIQSNKTKLVAENFTWVHSLNREKIAKRLNDQRPSHLGPLNVCLEVNISQEKSKSGLLDFKALSALAQFIIAACPRLKLRGLMSIPSPTDTFEAQRRPYAHLKQMFDELHQSGVPLDTLSMGMSYDLEAAIAEGATIVRVGQAIFGSRDFLLDKKSV
jgi:pyridoxal phosphate enzyme (YggS family)